MKIHILIGTKAELIKMVGLLKEFDKRKINYNFIHTGQHTKSGEELIKAFKLKNPNVWITKRKEDLKTINEAFFWTLKCILLGRKLNISKEDILIVHGDTESTLIGTVIAKIHGCKLAHVEGGLRSYKLLNPFPEEIIRRITDFFSKYIFCTSEWACSNIKRKRRKSVINIEGNTVIDAVSHSLKVKSKEKIPKEKYAVLMLHRKETLYVKKKLEIALKVIEKIVKRFHTIFIISKNTEYVLKKRGILNKLKKNSNVEIKGYYDYPTFIKLAKKSEFIAADSGGIQEETYTLNVPYLILREVTERQEGLEETACLSKLDMKKISYFLDNYKEFKRKSKIKERNPSKRIVDEIEKEIIKK